MHAHTHICTHTHTHTHTCTHTHTPCIRSSPTTAASLDINAPGTGDNLGGPSALTASRPSEGEEAMLDSDSTDDEGNSTTGSFGVSDLVKGVSVASWLSVVVKFSSSEEFKVC